MKTTYAFFLILIIISVVIYSCKEDSVTPTQVATCDQSCKDRYTAFALYEIWRITTNNNIGIRYPGYHDTTLSGPNGGTIHFTGSYTYITSDSGIVNCTFSMSDCKFENSEISFTFVDGDIAIEGQYSSNYKSLGFDGSSIRFFGNIVLNQTEPATVFEQSCLIDFDEITPFRAGAMCGRNFGYP